MLGHETGTSGSKKVLLGSCHRHSFSLEFGRTKLPAAKGQRLARTGGGSGHLSGCVCGEGMPEVRDLLKTNL